MPATITYQAGNEFSPSDPYGQETLTFFADGRLHYERRKSGRSWTQTGRADAAVLTALEAALTAAGFPEFPAHNIPPGAGLIQLTSQGQTATMHYFFAKKLAGYKDVISTADRWISWLRRPGSSADAPQGLHIGS